MEAWMRSIFEENTVQWFADTLGEPTAVQKEAWPAIAAGEHTLVSAPTGTGKTLSAFLVFLDRMKAEADRGELEEGLQLIYVSPLKSLAADIRENLKKPLDGLGAEKKIRVGIRTGDTPQKDRQRMIKHPPHILITTPESLYLMLTSRSGCEILKTAKAVILDELHVMIGTKRGAHLMLSLARLDRLCGIFLQRIGLSATMEPLETAAAYLAPEPVAVAAPPMHKEVLLRVLGPYANMAGKRKDPVWEELSALVYQHCLGNRSVIAFVEGRRYAEKLAYYVNQLGGQDFARVHHGSLAKEQRDEVERELREGRLRLLCATSSMELGIDVGEIDQVLQVGCPRTIAGTMQRLGRAGHNPGRVSEMYLFPRMASECVSCAMTAQLAREGGVEHLTPPEGCLDVLAQHLVSMAAFRGYEVDEVMELLPRAWPFRRVTKEDVKSVLGMLAGDYEHDRDIPVRPRILYDRIHERVEGDGYSRLLAVSAGGTIPDKGLYTVRTQDGVTLGELDEEFIYESQKGDRFLLGAFAWQILEIDRNFVTVAQTSPEGARLPFWKGELKGREKRTGEAFGKILRRLQQAYEEDALAAVLADLGLDEPGVELAKSYLERQIKATGVLPDDRTILVEHYRDQSGNSHIMVHSVFGRRVNAPLSLLAAHAAREKFGRNVGCVDEEDGFLLYSYGDGNISEGVAGNLPGSYPGILPDSCPGTFSGKYLNDLPEGLLWQIDPEECIGLLEAILPATPLFNMAFRYNSGRALMMGVRKSGRLPLWMQRLRSAEMLDHAVQEKEHPLMRETRRECLTEIWDVEGLRTLLADIRSGAVEVREIHTQFPSPMSLPLQWRQEAEETYNYFPTPQGVHTAAGDALKAEKWRMELKNLRGDALLHPGEEELAGVQERSRLPENEQQLHSLLMTEGDLAAGELEIPAQWLEALASQGRVLYLEQGLWIAAEQEEAYRRALQEGERGECSRIVRRSLRYRGASDLNRIAARYGMDLETAQEVLSLLVKREEAVCQDGIYYHARLYGRARAHTINRLRNEITTRSGAAYAACLAASADVLPGVEAKERLAAVVKQYAGQSCPAALWEGILFPRRVKGYRESMLDSFLAEGEMFWHMDADEPGNLRFDFQEEIDWEADLTDKAEALEGKERIVYEALLKRGASFMQSLNSLLPGESSHETLLSLLGKGLVCADSFVPVRQFLTKGKTDRAAARQRVNVRVKALHAGRWDVVRPIKPVSVEEKVERCLAGNILLCRETAAVWGLAWQEALEILRIQEYTGQVRRGYFVEGLSGAQFVRSRDFAQVMRALEQPDGTIRWLNATDPSQPWGKILPHMEGRAFVNVPGCAVCLLSGRTAAVFERQGKTLRVFEEERLAECLTQFVEDYRNGKIFCGQKRVVVKEYPETAREALAAAGFGKEMQDYCLYR